MTNDPPNSNASASLDAAAKAAISTTPTPPKRAIEEGFPIVEINRLAEREYVSYKPIYQMHKWFARRASCVFRAILLGAIKPAGTDILEEFYKDHTNDPDTNGKVILDPFMGGGTTVVEALRLGCKVIGIDLNPVAWFIVKTEVEPVDLDELRAAFDRVAVRTTAGGKPVREELLSHYKTECPACGNPDADIIYVFWVKSAICTDQNCRGQVPLFSNYLVAQKTSSIRYHGDVKCPKCSKTFDWEIEGAAMVGNPALMVTNALDSSGRGNRRWAYAPLPNAKSKGEKEARVFCPWCSQEVSPVLSQKKRERKKVTLSVLYCPHCAEVWQYRGTVPDVVTCPACRNEYAWQKGNVGEKGKFVCACGNRDKILESIRKLAQDQLLPMQMYAIQGHCARCARVAAQDETESGPTNGHLWEGSSGGIIPSKGTAAVSPPQTAGLKSGNTILAKNNGKFFKRVTVADEARYQESCARWDAEKNSLPFPKQEIPGGQETHRLLEHHYRYWHQMFNPRQLLCLATLLKAIGEEPTQVLKEMLLNAFSNTLEANNLFTRNIQRRKTPGGTPPGGIFSRHDFQLKNTSCEQHVFGVVSGNNTWSNRRKAVTAGVSFSREVWDYQVTDDGNDIGRTPSHERFSRPDLATLRADDARALLPSLAGEAHMVVTDPPYGGNVNYAEISEFLYVWLRLGLWQTYGAFAPDHTPTTQEIGVNPSRKKTLEDFRMSLTSAFSRCKDVLKEGGLLVFSFHHAEEKMWEALLQAIFEAGFEINGVYPVHGKREESLHVLEKEAIAYDLIHVCHKRPVEATVRKRSWAGIRQEIRRQARAEIKLIEAGRYGRGLKGPDVNLILIGKCLELYSRHYGAVVTEENGVERPVPLREALGDIRQMVDQLVSRDRPLPSELEDIDRESYVYLTALCEKTEIKSDDVHKATRGIIEVDRLLDAGLMKKGRAKRGRTYEVYSPSERFNPLRERFRSVSSPVTGENLFGEDLSAPRDRGALLIDKLHFLMGLAEAKEDIGPWISRWGGDLPQLRVAADYLAKRRGEFAVTLKTVLGRMEVGPLLKSI